MIINSDKKVLLCQRNDRKRKALQMPQGGVDGYESYSQALMRELYEELNTSNFYIIQESKKLYKYDFPNIGNRDISMQSYRGQRQKWFLLLFLGDDTEIDVQNALTPEFSNHGWYDLPEIIPSIIFFKRHVYKGLLREFEEVINNCNIEEIAKEHSKSLIFKSLKDAAE